MERLSRKKEGGVGLLELPQGPSRWELLFHLGQIRHRVHHYFRQLHGKYGNLFYFTVRGRVNVFVNEPELVQQILVAESHNFTKDRMLGLLRQHILGDGLLTSEGDFWRRQRKLSAPAFRSKRIATYAQTMADFAAAHGASWRAGEVVDMDQEMMRLTLQVVAKLLFDADVSDEADEIGETLTDLMALFPRMMSPFVTFFLALPTPLRRRLERNKERLDVTIYRMIEERRRAPDEERDDLLSLLLAAQDEETGEGMTDKQLRDEALTLFLAGHETTANALSWAFTLLADHPQVDARLAEEAQEVLGREEDAATQYKELRYTRQVFAETMRLYPPAHMLGRRVCEDFQLGDFHVPAGARILMSPYVMHHDPRFWPDPSRFDPDRWLPEEEKKRPKFAYYPFGGGPRICIGQGFAWMEGVLLLAHLVRHWRARRLPGHVTRAQPSVTLRPQNGMPMRLHRRT